MRRLPDEAPCAGSAVHLKTLRIKRREFFWRAPCGDFAVLDEDRLIREAHRFFDVMRDVENRQAADLGNAADVVGELASESRIERGRGLVHDEHRLRGQKRAPE